MALTGLTDRSDWWNLIYFVTALLLQPPHLRGAWMILGDWCWLDYGHYHVMVWNQNLVNIWRTFGQPSWPSKFKISNINMTKKIFVSTVVGKPRRNIPLTISCFCAHSESRYRMLSARLHLKMCRPCFIYFSLVIVFVAPQHPDSLKIWFCTLWCFQIVEIYEASLRLGKKTHNRSFPIS